MEHETSTPTGWTCPACEGLGNALTHHCDFRDVMANPNMEPGRRLRLFRTDSHLSQKTLASRLNVDPSTLSKWERGKGRPTTEPAVALERMTGMPVAHWATVKKTAHE